MAADSLVYDVMRGRPLFDPVNGYYGDNAAYGSINNCIVHAAFIAGPTSWNGAYPSGVTPATFPGMSSLQVNGTTHLCRYDGATNTAFAAMGGGGAAVVSNSSTGSAAWAGGFDNVSTYGSCPVSVPMSSFYLM
jgi:hypothetical protein